MILIEICARQKFISQNKPASFILQGKLFDLSISFFLVLTAKILRAQLC